QSPGDGQVKGAKQCVPHQSGDDQFFLVFNVVGPTDEGGISEFWNADGLRPRLEGLHDDDGIEAPKAGGGVVSAFGNGFAETGQFVPAPGAAGISGSAYGYKGRGLSGVNVLFEHLRER